MNRLMRNPHSRLLISQPGRRGQRKGSDGILAATLLRPKRDRSESGLARRKFSLKMPPLPSNCGFPPWGATAESNIRGCRRAMHFQSELPYVASSALLRAPFSRAVRGFFARSKEPASPSGLGRGLLSERSLAGSSGHSSRETARRRRATRHMAGTLEREPPRFPLPTRASLGASPSAKEGENL